MLLSPGRVAVYGFGYLLLLFGVAYWAERRKDRGHSLISNPYVYSLSIAVYCTSWTYYGSVGRAATGGFSFLAVYLGPTLVAFSWWALLRRMVRVARANHITSIADFIASRYGKSAGIGALVTVMGMVGVSPYIGLQLEAVASTFDILTEYAPKGFLAWSFAPGFVLGDTAFLVAVVLSVFGGMFGARSLDASERHEGMVAAIALESLVKLGALLLVGSFVTWSVFGGFRDILGRISADRSLAQLVTLGPGESGSYSSWASTLYLSMAAVMLLPRQFHVMVVENCDEEHIRKAMWLFPLYLFLMTLFVIPIAFGGLLFFHEPGLADTFVLRIPLEEGRGFLALVTFIGGLSAATGMVVVSSVTLSTMFLNNLVMPVLVRTRRPHNFAPYLIHIKRLGIAGVILLGFAYYRLLGETFYLAELGLLSFAAVAQWAPAVMGGLFWPDATAKGAAAGLSLGFLSWGYMFLVPALATAGKLPPELLTGGPWGISLLRPTAFLGLEGLDIWTHGLFWSFFLNAGAFVGVSLFTRHTPAEREQVSKFLDLPGRERAKRRDVRLAGAPSVREFEDLLAKFIGPEKARERIREFFEQSRGTADAVTDSTLLELRGFVERTLAGAVGAASASTVVERYLALKGTTLEEIFDVFGAVSLSLEESREELESRVRELSVLFEASQRVASTLDEQGAISSVLDLIGEDFGLDYRGAFLLSGGRLQASSVRGFSPPYLEAISLAEREDSLVGRALAEKRTFFVSGRTSSQEPTPVELSANPGLCSVIASPILREQRVLGVLAAGSSVRYGYFSEKFLEAFQALASELALAISNSRLYEEVRELNRTLEEKVRERTRELETANRNLQELDRLKSEFLANMSHELRTPMNSILGYTQLVLDEVDGPVTAEQAASLSRVETNARHLLQLINDILDLSKIEAGRLELEVHEFHLGDLAREVVEDLEAVAKRKGLPCRYEKGEGDLWIEADANRTREVLNNLINNAIKFTDRGEVSVRACPALRGEEEGVEVAVVDTGIGIAAESLEEIFVAFRQLDSSSTRPHGGTGLGLSIAKRLVELQGGRIEVRSRLGEGSEFTIWLPKRGPVEDGG